MNVDPSGRFVITLSALFIAMGIGAAAGLIAGGVYGGLTAAANGQNVGWGILIGALSGAFMGAGAGAAGLFIAPILAGGAVVVGTTTLCAGAALGIGAGIALLSGFIGGMGSDLWLQKVNGQKIDFGAAALTGLQWALLNVANTFTVGLGGILDNLANFALLLFFNFFYGAIGMLFDVIKGKKTNQNKQQTIRYKMSFVN